ncbi:MAG: ATP-binding cassette domain-containing protein, partial [Candidatus Izemoplasmatales bacterium]|nr:ATP-binding cassette domain-containing protein [Candidatus Izemoplasmatales bacterium]
VLTPQEIDGLFDVIRFFAKEGKSIIIITHKLNEIMDIADRCTILRKGKCIKTVDVKDVNAEVLAELMVGREVNFTVEKTVAVPKEIVFEVQNLNLFDKDKTKKILNDINFNVRSGEIVCVAGIEGNGQTQLVRAISGLNPSVEAGSVMILNGINIVDKSIRDRIELGLSHIPEDRQRYGLIMDYNLSENMVSNTYYHPEFQKHGLIRFDQIKKYTEDLIQKYDIRSSLGATSSARSMSGGNQQKAIIARETSKNHNFLLAAQPTRGLDVGAIEYVHKTLIAERDRGNAILVISLELDEVMNISDRILVMHEGSIYAELDPKKTTISEIGLYMSGSKRQTSEVKHEQV